MEYTYVLKKGLETAQKLPDGVVPNVTYRAMCVKGFENLLVAGRCASADRKVMGQIRIMGYCFMMGEAVGLAAAIACRKGCDPADIDIGILQQELLNNQIPTL